MAEVTHGLYFDMVTQWHGNTFKIIGPFQGKFVGDQMWSFDVALLLAWTSTWANHQTEWVRKSSDMWICNAYKIKIGISWKTFVFV